MATHSSTLAWKILWTEEHGRLQSMGSLRVRQTEWLHFHFSLSCVGERNGNPLQCSCLENPRDGGAWWAAVYGVAQSQTWLKRLSSSSRTIHIIFKALITVVTNYPLSVLTVNCNLHESMDNPYLMPCCVYFQWLTNSGPLIGNS